jgi:hypothetical protein
LNLLRSSDGEHRFSAKASEARQLINALERLTTKSLIVEYSRMLMVPKLPLPVPESAVHLDKMFREKHFIECSTDLVGG